MTARHSLDQIERGLDGVTPDHERIWLQNDNDAHGCEGRLWCQDKVWPEDDEQGEPTEYVRADLYEALENESEELRIRLAGAFLNIGKAEARATAAEATVAALQEALKFYANAANWEDGHFAEDEPNTLTLVPSTIDDDRGDIARTALTTIRGTDP